MLSRSDSIRFSCSWFHFKSLSILRQTKRTVAWSPRFTLRGVLEEQNPCSTWGSIWVAFTHEFTWTFVQRFVSRRKTDSELWEKWVGFGARPEFFWGGWFASVLWWSRWCGSWLFCASVVLCEVLLSNELRQRHTIKKTNKSSKIASSLQHSPQKRTYPSPLSQTRESSGPKSHRSIRSSPEDWFSLIWPLRSSRWMPIRCRFC